MRRTKIVCTIGPGTASKDRIAALLAAGMNVARLNLSHGTREEHCRYIEMIRNAARRLGKIPAIMVDTRGPEVRTGKVAGEPVMLEGGQEESLTVEGVA